MVNRDSAPSKKLLTTWIDRHLGKLESVVVTEVACPPLVDLAQNFSQEPSVLLLSGGSYQGRDAFNFLGLKPLLTITGRRGTVKLHSDDDSTQFTMGIFDSLEALVSSIVVENDTSFPMKAGLMGYLAFECHHELEKIPRTYCDDLSLPDCYMILPGILLVEDLKSNRRFLLQPKFTHTGSKFLESIKELKVPNSQPWQASHLRSNFNRSEYGKAIDEIKNLIGAGDVYQVNLSQRLSLDFRGDPFLLFRALWERNPTPHFAFINAGDHQVVSSSPELFLSCDGSSVIAHPIKGTRPRGGSDEEDKALEIELATSPKESAELAMIVDLLRNDLSKTAKVGSVVVQEFKKLKQYTNVIHLDAKISSKLRSKCSVVELLKGCFPSGSVTGCPKIRAIEIISQLEPNPRHVYTGAIGYLSFHRTLEMSVAIRTALLCEGKIHLGVGGGIVFDSQPEAEYEETLYKAKNFLDLLAPTEWLVRPSGSGRRRQVRLRSLEGERENGGKAWVNGRFVSSGDPLFSALSPAVLYGKSLFETLRWESGVAVALTEHIERLTQSANLLGFPRFPAIDWNEVVTSVVTINQLQDQRARIRILAASNYNEPLTFVVTAEVLPPFKSTAYHLLTFPYHHATWLGRFKSGAYLNYHLAQQWAAARGADDSLLLDHTGHVIETARASLFFRDNEKLRVTVPSSVWQLPGVTRNLYLKELEPLGYRIESRQVHHSEIEAWGELWIANSLMGALPATSIDGRILERKGEGGEAQRLNLKFHALDPKLPL